MFGNGIGRPGVLTAAAPAAEDASSEYEYYYVDDYGNIEEAAPDANEATGQLSAQPAPAPLPAAAAPKPTAKPEPQPIQAPAATPVAVAASTPQSEPIPAAAPAPAATSTTTAATVGIAAANFGPNGLFQSKPAKPSQKPTTGSLGFGPTALLGGAPPQMQSSPHSPVHTSYEASEEYLPYEPADDAPQLWAGHAIVLSGVVTSISGPRHTFKYNSGLLEFVPFFDGKLVPAKQRSALPEGVPVVVDKKYTWVFDEEGDYYKAA